MLLKRNCHVLKNFMHNKSFLSYHILSYLFYEILAGFARPGFKILYAVYLQLAELDY